jgi:maltose O-acetyltransferase
MSWVDYLRGLAVPRRARHALVRLSGLTAFPNCRVGRSSGAWTRIVVDVRGRATIGDRVLFLSGIAPCELKVAPGAALSIGDDCYFNYGTALEVTESVRIGNRCMFGSFVRIADAAGEKRGPVVLGDDVWVAHGALIEPGVTIGDGAVVSAGAVVTADVPPRTMAMGNPARVMPLSLSSEPGRP